MENNKKGIVLKFFKKYGYYMVAIMLILGITVGVALSSASMPKSTQKVEPTQNEPIIFGLPLSDLEVVKWYSDSELMYNDTLKQWESHKGVDMVVNGDDNSVYSVLNGKITNIEDTYEFGTIVTITHDNGFVSKYSSLDANLCVNLSDTVKLGERIGTISSTANTEQKMGDHLHFELLKDGQKVDPANYLTLENK